MKVLVTGGSGFIGSHTVDLLLAKGYDVAIVDRVPPGEERTKEVRYYQLQLGMAPLAPLFQREKPDVIIHLAAQVSVPASLRDPYQDALHNILATVSLLEHAVRYQVKKLVFASSAAVYGEPEYLPVDEEHPLKPQSFYGLSKRTAESYIRLYGEQYGLRFAILRYANVYGMGQKAEGEGGVIPIFIHRILRQERPVIYGDGGQKRDFIFVKDVAAANLAAMHGGGQEIVNISTNSLVTINGLLTMIGQITQSEIEPIYQPPRKGDIRVSILANCLAQDRLSWRHQFSLFQGLQQTVEYEKRRLTNP